MSSMNVSLPDDLRRFAEDQAAAKGLASADEYLRAVLEEDRKRKAMQDLVAKLDEAISGGPAEPMTREDWDALKRNVWERHRRVQSPETTPQ